jgi:hypothetical protein
VGRSAHASARVVAFYGGVLAFHHLVQGFKVTLFTDSSVVASIAENGRARSELMQLVHAGLLSSAAWRDVAPSAKATYLSTEANAFSDAGTRQRLASRFAALCAQAGVHARPAAPQTALPLMLDTLWALARRIYQAPGRARVGAHSPVPQAVTPPATSPPVHPRHRSRRR